MAAAGLPYEAQSPSELLSSTHVFAFVPLALQSTPWALGADHMEHREVTMKARLGEVFKGQLDVKPAEEFTFRFGQRRESEFIVSDYHGLWSHLELTVGAPYVAISGGSTDSVAELLKEENCRGVFDGGYLEDVKAVLEGERGYRSAGQGDAVAASLALISITRAKAPLVHDLFERYLWARVGPTFRRSHEAVLPQILELVSFSDATTLFRGALISDVYQAVVLMEPNLPLTSTVVRELFSLLGQKSAAPLAAHLVEVELYNLTVRDGRANLPVAEVFPDRAEREGYRALLVPFKTDRARQIENWLGR